MDSVVQTLNASGRIPAQTDNMWTVGDISAGTTISFFL